MVEKLQSIIGEIRAEKGEITFFGLFKMDELTDKWSVLFCASWMNPESFEDFKYFADKLKAVLTTEESATIARIGLFSEDEHLMQLMLNYKSGARICDQQVNGNLIHDGYVLVSNKEIESRFVPI